jgi:hypothetical protein
LNEPEGEEMTIMENSRNGEAPLMDESKTKSSLAIEKIIREETPMI